jgi:hypothetical protein
MPFEAVQARRNDGTGALCFACDLWHVCCNLLDATCDADHPGFWREQNQRLRTVSS